MGSHVGDLASCGFAFHELQLILRVLQLGLSQTALGAKGRPHPAVLHTPCEISAHT